MLILAALLGGIVALALRGQRNRPESPAPEPAGPPGTSPIVDLPVPNPAPVGAPSPKHSLGEMVRRGKTLIGKVIFREYSDDHRQWIYRLDCPECPRGGILESDLAKV